MLQGRLRRCCSSCRDLAFERKVTNRLSSHAVSCGIRARTVLYSSSGAASSCMLQRIASMSSAGAVLGGHRVRLGSNNGSLLRPDLQTLLAGHHARRSAAPYRMDVRMGSSGRFFVGGNWKANGTKESVSKLVSGLNSAQFPSEVDVIVAPTFIHLPYVVENIDSRYQVSAQNCWVGRAGAYTGEVRDLGSLTFPICVVHCCQYRLHLPSESHAAACTMGSSWCVPRVSFVRTLIGTDTHQHQLGAQALLQPIEERQYQPFTASEGLQMLT